jgi:glycosyltransferase involved in cell wall biosynthesis
MVVAWTAPNTGRLNRRHESVVPVGSRVVPGALKICIISETFHAGVGRHIVDVARALAAKNHEVHVLYSDRRLDRNFLAEIQSQPGIRCHAIPMPRGICPADIKAFRQIKAYVKAHGPFDIVHGESSKGGGYARLLKLFGAKTVIYSPHAFVTLSPVVPRLKKFVYHAIEVVLAQLTSRVICTSYSEEEHARWLGISQNKLAMIFNGSDPVETPDRSQIRAGLGITPEQIVVGYAGRMEDQKAPNRLIDAALLLLPKMPNLHLLMIGDGPKREYLEVRMRKAGLADRVSWTGAVDARQYMPAMDIFALPSRYEGFPYVLLEALNAGLPVVSTPVGGALESVVPGVNGMIVPHDDPREMAGALQRLTLDANLRRAMARASKERAAKFSIPRMVSALEHLYFESSGRTVSDLGNETARALASRNLEAASAIR